MVKEKKQKPRGISVPIGNELWKIRSKHGTDLLFKSPELLWEAACEYFEWCIKNPLMKAENKVVSNGGNMGSSVELHEEPVKRPFTLDGLCLYMKCNSAYLRQFKTNKAYLEKGSGFPTVIDAIERTIFNQQYEGAASGFFNANIVSRALGLIDKQDITTAGEKIAAPEFKIFNSAPPLAGDEKSVENRKK